MMRLVRLAPLTAALVATTALAGPVTFLTLPPSDESAITVEVDQSQLQGLLSKQDFDDLVKAGGLLFDARFTTKDGAGQTAGDTGRHPDPFQASTRSAVPTCLGTGFQCLLVVPQ